MKKIIFAIIMKLLSSCDRYSFNSGIFGGYKIDSWSSLQRYIILDKVGTKTDNSSNGHFRNDYTLLICIDSNNVIDSSYATNEGKVIYNYVDYFVSDYEKFILVAQIDMKELWEYKSMREMVNILKMKRKKGEYQYWIINKNDDIIYGPFNQSKFIEKRKELDVPKELKMKFEK